MSTSIGFNTQSVQPHPNLSDIAKNATESEKRSLIVKISKIARHSLNSLTHVLHSLGSNQPLQVIKTVTLGISGLKLFALALLPATLAKLDAGYKAEAKATLNETVDIYLGRIDAYGALGEIFTKTVEGLTHIYTAGLAGIGCNASTLNSMSNFVKIVASPLSIVFAVFQGFGMVLTTKNLIETHRFSIIFNKSAALDKPTGDYAQEDFASARQLIETNQAKEKSFVAKHFDTSSDKLIARLHAIEAVAKQAIASVNPKEVLEAKQQLKTTMQTLSGRLTSRQWSNALNLLASTVSTVGFGLSYSPCPIAGFALSGIGASMSIGNFFHDKYRTAQFETTLGIEGG